jgi:two-component system chemotaxis response regulator CheY
MIGPTSRVLLVDDFDLMRTMLHKSLNTLGIQSIDNAVDGEEALARIAAAMEKKQPYDVLFLDWNMPKKSGYEVLEFCRGNAALKDVIVVMVTAESEMKLVMKALTAGANDYIVKPCSTEVLKAKIEHINKQIMKRAG